MIFHHLNFLIPVSLLVIITPLLSVKCSLTSAYVIPTPVIRVFRPRGFQVSIPYVKGMQEFTFSANVNEPISNFFDPREVQFSKTTIEPRRSGRMTIQDRVSRFRIGDKIHYRLEVKKEDEDYSLTNQIFVVTGENIFRQPQHEPEVEVYYYPRITPSSSSKTTSTMPPDNFQPSLDPVHQRTTTVKPDNNTELDNCNDKIFSLLEKVSWLVTEIDRLSDENRLLYKIGNSVSDGRRLFLSGKVSHTDDPVQVVQFVLSEKLNMTPNIESAMRSENNMIQFKVESLDVKMEILRKVEEKLGKSKSINIFD